MEVKVGDVVHVKGVVMVAKDNWASVDIKGIWGSLIPVTEIVHVEPQPIRVGEIVRHRSTNWVVLGVEDGMLWIKEDGPAGPVYLSTHRDQVQRYS